MNSILGCSMISSRLCSRVIILKALDALLWTCIEAGLLGLDKSVALEVESIETHNGLECALKPYA